jgi:hypothetical protein
MLNFWTKQKSLLVKLAIPVLFGVAGLLTAIIIHFLSLSTDNKLLLLIIGILVPSAVSLIVVSEVVLLWFYEI